MAFPLCSYLFLFYFFVLCQTPLHWAVPCQFLLFLLATKMFYPNLHGIQVTHVFHLFFLPSKKQRLYSIVLELQICFSSTGLINPTSESSASGFWLLAVGLMLAGPDEGSFALQGSITGWWWWWWGKGCDLSWGGRVATRWLRIHAAKLSCENTRMNQPCPGKHSSCAESELPSHFGALNWESLSPMGMPSMHS